MSTTNYNGYSYTYPRPQVTVDAIVFHHDEWGTTRILLVTRGKEPYKGRLAFPGGFINLDELLVDACVRELEEETGLIVPAKRMKFFKMADKVDRDPRARTIGGIFTTELESDSPPDVTGQDDADYAAWYEVDKVNDADLWSFDHHELFINAYSKLF